MKSNKRLEIPLRDSRIVRKRNLRAVFERYDKSVPQQCDNGLLLDCSVRRYDSGFFGNTAVPLQARLFGTVQKSREKVYEKALYRKREKRRYVAG